MRQKFAYPSDLALSSSFYDCEDCEDGPNNFDKKDQFDRNKSAPGYAFAATLATSSKQVLVLKVGNVLDTTT